MKNIQMSLESDVKSLHPQFQAVLGNFVSIKRSAANSELVVDYIIIQ